MVFWMVILIFVGTLFVHKISKQYMFKNLSYMLKQNLTSYLINQLYLIGLCLSFPRERIQTTDTTGVAGKRSASSLEWEGFFSLHANVEQNTLCINCISLLHFRLSRTNPFILFFVKSDIV